MKKCINIFEGIYVNLDQVVSFDIDKSQVYEGNKPQVVISIYTSSHPANEYSWFTVTQVEDEYDTESRDGTRIYVKIQEVHRIIRELCAFFEVDAPRFEK